MRYTTFVSGAPTISSVTSVPKDYGRRRYDNQPMRVSLADSETPCVSTQPRLIKSGEVMSLTLDYSVLLTLMGFKGFISPRLATYCVARSYPVWLDTTHCSKISALKV